MTTIEVLTEKRDELARSLKAQEAAGESLAAARKRYDKKVTAALEALKQQLEAENQEITDALNAAQKAKLDADDAVREQRDTLKNVLLPWYASDTGKSDKKPLPGVRPA
jgi:seryl-tRNA synthetase